MEYVQINIPSGSPVEQTERLKKAVLNSLRWQVKQPEPREEDKEHMMELLELLEALTVSPLQLLS